MTFTTVPVQITGPSYQNKSKPLSSQQTVNFYPESTPLGKDQYVLTSWPGLKFERAITGKDRGFHRMAETLYQIKGNRIYQIREGQPTLSQGTIEGVNRCIMADDGVNIYIVADTKVYRFNSDDFQVTEVTDPNIVGAKSVCFINNQFIYTKDRFSIVSNVGDGSTASGLNIIGEETLPDNMVRDFIFDDIIYRCSERSIVAWYNSGVGNPPIERLQGRIFQTGLAAIHSIARTDEAFYWLGDDFSIYQSNAGAKNTISTDAISHEIKKYARVDDAVAHTITIDGANYYIITFPTGDKTFVYSERLGQQGWFEIAGDDGGRYQGSSFQQVYGKTYVADETNGRIYTLDSGTYTNNGLPILRKRVTGSVNGDLLGAKGKLIQMSCAKFIMEAGVGLINETTTSLRAENPRIAIEYSDDGGRTWRHGGWPSVGRLGENTLQVVFYNLGKFYDRIFRISTSDQVNYTIYSGTIDLRIVSDGK